MTVYIWATYELHQDFMLIKPTSPAMLELITPSFERYRSKSHTRASLLLFWFICTQCHAGLLPAKPRDHTWSHVEATPRSALPINGTACPIRIHITLQVNLWICLILEPIINCTLQVPQNMLCSNQVNMSRICQELAQCVHSKANIWSRIL